MLRFMYTTDLHGDTGKYTEVLQRCKDYGIKILHLGSDLLPKGSGILGMQKKFINGYLKEFYRECTAAGITLLAFFGNDDIYSRKKYFKKYSTLLDENPVELSGYTFSAYGYVPDYPFTMKTACKTDHDGWQCPDEYLGDPVEVTATGEFEEILDIKTYFKNKGTIENDLKALQGGSKAIVAIHCPPQGVNLDVCHNGRRVGSKAIYDWTLKNQPLCLLTGHIHESPKMTGIWQSYIKDTLVIQPGQFEHDKVSYVIVEIDQDKVTSFKFDTEI